MAKLNIGDTVIIAKDMMDDLKVGQKYTVTRMTKNRLGADLYVFRNARKNAVNEIKTYVNDIDGDLDEHSYQYYKESPAICKAFCKPVLKVEGK